VTYDRVETKIAPFATVLQSRACEGATIAKSLARRLKQKVVKARTRLARADTATEAKLITKLVGKADHLLDVAADVLASATEKGLVPQACADALSARCRSARCGAPRRPRPRARDAASSRWRAAARG
jgi:hypothetical protein